MKISDEVYVRGYVDEIRQDTVIIRNDGGYFGTIPSEVVEQIPKQEHWVGTPKEFAEKMYQLAENCDTEVAHIKADELMCQLLTSLGYGEGVKVFQDMYKWYS